MLDSVTFPLLVVAGSPGSSEHQASPTASQDAQFTDTERVAGRFSLKLIDVVGVPTNSSGGRFVRREIAVPGECSKPLGGICATSRSIPVSPLPRRPGTVSTICRGTVPTIGTSVRTVADDLRDSNAGLPAASWLLSLMPVAIRRVFPADCCPVAERRASALMRSSLFRHDRPVVVGRSGAGPVTSCCTISTLPPGGSRRSCCSGFVGRR